MERQYRNDTSKFHNHYIYKEIEIRNQILETKTES